MNDSRSFEIGGAPTPEEEEKILRALEQMLRDERAARAPPAWKMAGRALASRNGVLDYRGRTPGSGWVAARYLPWMGQVYNGRHGRGDAK